MSKVHSISEIRMKNCRTSEERRHCKDNGQEIGLQSFGDKA